MIKRKGTIADKMAKSLMDDIKGMQSYGMNKPKKKDADNPFAQLINSDPELLALKEKNELEALIKNQASANIEKISQHTKTGNKNLLKENLLVSEQPETISISASGMMDPTRTRKASESDKTVVLSDLENRPLGLNDFPQLKNDSKEGSDYSIKSAGLSQQSSSYITNHENTVSAAGNKNQSTQSMQAKNYNNQLLESEVQVTYGLPKSQLRNQGGDNLSNLQSQLQQADTLKIAQIRIIDLEKEVDRLRRENDGLLSAGELNNKKNEEYIQRIQSLERAKFDAVDLSQQEVRLYKENVLVKDQEIIRLRNKLEEVNQRLNADMKKVRVRERELENRLELSKMEKVALVRTKDESILELKRKIDLMSVELDNYKTKCIELNQKIENNQEQFSRTVRALRLALTNLEANEHTLSINLAPLKKAE